MAADAGASTALCLSGRLGSYTGVVVGARAHGGPVHGGCWCSPRGLGYSVLVKACDSGGSLGAEGAGTLWAELGPNPGLAPRVPTFLARKMAAVLLMLGWISRRGCCLLPPLLCPLG